MIVGQNEIIEQITQYLKAELRNITDPQEIKNRQEVIEYFEKSDGICEGLSTLWAFGKHIQNYEKQMPERDDYEFFKNTLQLIGEFVEEGRELTVQEKNHIEILISNIMLYQSASDRGKLEGLKGSTNLGEVNKVLDSQGNQSIEVFGENIVINKEYLEQRLTKVLKPDTMIMIGSSNGKTGHVISVRVDKMSNVIEFYDPTKGEKNFDNIKELTDQLWDCLKIPAPFGKMTIADFLIPNAIKYISVNAFQFEKDPKYNYPSKAEWDLSSVEVKQIITESPIILKHKTNADVKKFIDFIAAATKLELLQDVGIDHSVKNVLAELFSNSIGGGSWGELQSYLFNNYKDSIDPQLLTHILQCKTEREDELKEKSMIVEQDNKVIIRDNNSIVVKKISPEETFANLKEYADVAAASPKLLINTMEKLIASKAELSSSPLYEDTMSYVTNHLREIKESLSFTEALRVLTYNIGNEALVDDLLNNCQDTSNTDKFLKGLIPCIISENIKTGNFQVAKLFISILANRFDIMPTLDVIEEINDFSLTKYVSENFDYSDKFGNAPISFALNNAKCGKSISEIHHGFQIPNNDQPLTNLETMLSGGASLES